MKKLIRRDLSDPIDSIYTAAIANEDGELVTAADYLATCEAKVKALKDHKKRLTEALRCLTDVRPTHHDAKERANGLRDTDPTR